MNLFHTLRELLWENPMTLEATRTLRRCLRAGSDNENPYATRKLNRFLVGMLGFLYLWTIFGLVRANEDISIHLVLVELLLLTLIVPCSLYGAIAVEREKQTYESLIMTRLTPAQIVCGKLWWRVGLIVGVMALFAPLLIVSHLTTRNWGTEFTTTQLLWTQVQIFFWSVFVGAFSLWVSAKSKKGITALLGIVATLLVFLAMVPLLMNLFGMLYAQIPLRDSRLYGEFYGGFPDSYQDQINAYRRLVILGLSSSLLFALNPVNMVITLQLSLANGGSTGHELWRMLGVNYWGVGVYVILTAVFIRAAIKTLRGLEMPAAEKARRSRGAFALPKGDA